MKKLLFVALTTLSLLGMAACGSNQDENAILEDLDHKVCVAGHHEISVNNEWTANAWEFNVDGSNLMTPTSISEVKKLDAAVGKAFAKKKLKSLYKVEIRMGVTAAGWTTNCLKADGKLYSTDGSYTVKAILGHVEDVDGEQVYANDQWIPDPKTGYCESLSPSTLFIPVWQEELDENGLSWANNPVCISGAGIYTFVVAQYKNASAVGKPGFGAALILKEKLDGGQEYTPVKKFAERTWGIIGSMAASNWTTDIPMTISEDKKSFSATVELAEGDEFKVRADAAWGTAYGASAVDTELKSAFDLTGENIKVVTAGTYKISVTDAGKVLINDVK